MGEFHLSKLRVAVDSGVVVIQIAHLPPEPIQHLVAVAGSQAECFPGSPETVGLLRDLARVALLSNTQTFGLELLDRLGTSAPAQLGLQFGPE